MRYFLFIVAALPAWACVSVEGDRILGKDLAAAAKEFAALDPAAEIGFAPRPGVTRVFQPWELAALARKSGIPANGRLESVCFIHPAEAAPRAQKPVVADVDVVRGEQVAVEVTSGAAVLRFHADAETSGRLGESVLIRNPENGRLFQARVDGKGKAIVQR